MITVSSSDTIILYLCENNKINNVMGKVVKNIKSGQILLNRYRQLPENMQIQVFDLTERLFQYYIGENEIYIEDAQNYSTFEKWNSTLQKLDGRNDKEYLPEFDMTLIDYRKIIWDMEQSENLSFEDGKKEINLCLEKLL